MTDSTAVDPETLARAASESMYARDRAARHMGMQIEEIRPGYARLSMTVLEWMVQGHAMCHGGLMFALADTAMAYASNSHNEQHVAMHANIDFLRPAREGERLLAEASEDHRSRRMGMYNVSIVNAEGEALCHFRGRTYGVGGAVLR